MDIGHVLTDAVVTRALGAALSVLLLAGAWQKLRDRELFQAAVENYQLVPQSWLAFIATGLSLLELAAGILLLPASTRPLGASLTGVVLLVVTGAVVINLLRGRTDIDCGCGGLSAHAGEQSLTWALVMRNVLLLAALLLSLSDSEQRPLVWFDYLTVAGTTLALLGLYVAANQLMANQPRLESLRTH